MRGLVPSQAHSHMGFQRFAPYAADEYVAVRETTTREMVEETAVVVERVAKGLLRGLGVDHRLLPYGDPSEIALRSQ
jgi:hypothetical protein